MPQKKAVTPWEKEFARLERRRRAYQARHARPPESRLDRALEDKVPPKLREALNSAFVKAFDLVFQRGTGLLERTFDAEAARPHAPRCWTSLPSPPVRRRTMTRGHRSAGLPLS